MRLPSLMFRRCRQGLAALVLLGLPWAASAQMDKANRNMAYIRDGILGVCVVVFSVLFIWAGIEIAAKHKRAMEVWPVILGATVVAMAGTAAAFLVN